ncbi:Aminopeptidase Q, partial [Frankliniella fusca]
AGWGWAGQPDARRRQPPHHHGEAECSDPTGRRADDETTVWHPFQERRPSGPSRQARRPPGEWQKQRHRGCPTQLRSDPSLEWLESAGTALPLLAWSSKPHRRRGLVRFAVGWGFPWFPSTALHLSL